MASSVNPAKKALLGRAISVRVRPPPVNFAERRSILQVLEQHGAVEHFRAVPGHDSMYVSIMKEGEAASSLITRSPLSYDVSVARSNHETYLADLKKPFNFAKARPVVKVAPDDGAAAPAPQEEAEDSQKFTLHVWPSYDYNHSVATTASLLHKTWPDFVLEDDSFITGTLKKSLPDNLAAKGLAIWEPDFGKQRLPRPHNARLDLRVAALQWAPSKLRGVVQGRRPPRRPENREGSTA